MARILIVDDSEVIRMQLAGILTNAGYDVVGEAVDGEDAYVKYTKLKPDLVTMDITMPNVNGLQGLKRIKRFDPKARIVMITAMGQKSYVVDAVKSGALDYIIKPFNSESVETKIKKALEKEVKNGLL